MAKFILPLEYYSGNLIKVISDLFSSETSNLYIGLYSIIEDSVIGRTGQWKYGLKDHFIQESAYGDVQKMDELHIPELVQQFEWDAKKYGVKYDVHYLNNKSIQGISYECKFGNLMVCNFNSSTYEFESLKEEIGGESVIFLNTNCQKIETIFVPILSDDSYEAVKQLSLVLPSLSVNKLINVIVKPPVTKDDIRKEKYLVEFLRSNFKNVSINWFLTDNTEYELERLVSDSKYLMVFNKKCSISNDIINYLIGKNTIFSFIIF